MLFKKIFSTCFLVSSLFFLASCASVQNPANPADPYEGYNRKVFAFNQVIDKYLYKPVAKTYYVITPRWIRTRVSRFFSNVDVLSDIANDILQANVPWSVSDINRFAINTTVGLLGLFDPATSMGLVKHHQDLGLTFAKWGMRDSPYFIFPFLPPATVRDFIGGNLDAYALSPWTYIKPERVGYWARAGHFVTLRADALKADPLIEQAFDPYVFVRNFYLQTRKNRIDEVLSYHFN